jgi:hypothetical protein
LDDKARADRIKQLKTSLTLVNVSLTNAGNKLKDGHVISPSIIEELTSRQAQLKADIERLENGEDLEAPHPSPLTSHPSPEPEGDEYGIPERLRVKRRPYTLSPEALKQRKDAANSPAKADAMKGNRNAWKHGENAKGFLRQIFRPCKSTCTQYPCSLVKEGETEPGEQCIDKVQLAQSLHAFNKALSEGDITDLKDLAAVRLAGGFEVVGQLLQDILQDGTLIKSEKFDKEGGLLGYDLKSHPSLFHLGRLMETLNLSPADFMITPREIAKKETDDEGVKNAADILSRLAGVKKREE